MRTKKLFLLFLILTGITIGLSFNTIRVNTISKINISKKVIGNTPESSFQSGDVIFQSSNSGQSLAIKLATKSVYTHCGMLFERNGKWMVLEAVEPVCWTPFETWIKRGDNDAYLVKRLKNADSLLTKETISSMIEHGNTWEGLHYDVYFGWDDERMYCSELVWKIYYRTLQLEVGRLQQLSDFDLSHPEVQKIVKQRYGEDIPWNETVISPGEIAAWDGWITVENTYSKKSSKK
jgi:hypothetical protein